jgi:hypothetical protein
VSLHLRFFYYLYSSFPFSSCSAACMALIIAVHLERSLDKAAPSPPQKQLSVHTRQKELRETQSPKKVERNNTGSDSTDGS